jgi:hypothetical protein
MCKTRSQEERGARSVLQARLALAVPEVSAVMEAATYEAVNATEIMVRRELSELSVKTVPWEQRGLGGGSIRARSHEFCPRGWLQRAGSVARSSAPAAGRRLSRGRSAAMPLSGRAASGLSRGLEERTIVRMGRHLEIRDGGSASNSHCRECGSRTKS